MSSATGSAAAAGVRIVSSVMVVACAIMRVILGVWVMVSGCCFLAHIRSQIRDQPLSTRQILKYAAGIRQGAEHFILHSIVGINTALRGGLGAISISKEYPKEYPNSSNPSPHCFFPPTSDATASLVA